MNLTFAASFVLLAFFSGVSAVVEPHRISYGRLSLDTHEVLQALQTTGMIAISDVPGLNKIETLNALPECISKTSSSGASHEFADGTLRRTIATSSREPLDLSDASCQEFQKLSTGFRQAVHDASRSFVHLLSSELGLRQEPLLKTTTEGADLTLQDIIELGEHIEHFHAYYKDKEPSSTLKETIEMHMDQGMMLAFTPGMVNGKPTDGFYIQLADGTTEMVQFEAEDDLVIFFGDAIQSIVNADLKAKEKTPLRVLPHALSMPVSAAPRVWYGIMMMPPQNAIHPSLEQNTTYGEIRQALIAGENMALGCSSSALTSRLLVDASTCTNQQAYCWHRCMSYTEYKVSPTICAANGGKQVACANAKGERWPGGDVHDPNTYIQCLAKPSTAFCFSGASLVDVLGEKGTIPISEVKIGDLVRVGDSNRFERVYSFGHKVESQIGEFLKIVTASASTLEISSNHMIMHKSHGYVPASSLRQGDVLVNGQGRDEIVKSIKAVKAAGVYAPFTASGTIVVNNIQASSYIAFEGKASLEVGPVSFSYQWLAHAFEFPHRVACHYLGSCPRETYNKDGVSTWVASSLQFGQWILNQPDGFFKGLVLTAFVGVVSIFSLLESLLRHPMTFVVAAALGGVVVTSSMQPQEKKKVLDK